jgi:hypothetical protein
MQTSDSAVSLLALSSPLPKMTSFLIIKSPAYAEFEQGVLLRIAVYGIISFA